MSIASNSTRPCRPSGLQKSAARCGASATPSRRCAPNGASWKVRRASRRSPNAICSSSRSTPTQFDKLNRLPDRPPQLVKPDSPDPIGEVIENLEEPPPAMTGSIWPPTPAPAIAPRLHLRTQRARQRRPRRPPQSARTRERRPQIRRLTDDCVDRSRNTAQAELAENPAQDATASLPREPAAHPLAAADGIQRRISRKRASAGAGVPIVEAPAKLAATAPAEPWRRRALRALLYGSKVDRNAKARARVGLAILAFAVVYFIIAVRLDRLRHRLREPQRASRRRR